MQGRISPPPPGRLQAFPLATWEGEFSRARALGFDFIEWIFEDERHEENPLFSKAGRRRITELAGEHGVQVASVCADYFMPHPFFRVSSGDRQYSIDMLRSLIESCAEIGATLILVPVLEVSAIREEREVDELAEALTACLPAAHAAKVRLGLETELPVAQYAGLIERIGNEAVGAYYDIGNAASQGYDCASDIRTLGASIYGLHIKDRVRDGVSVPLGQGAADFPSIFNALHDISYRGRGVLQTAFGPDYMAFARTHLRFVEELIALATARASK